MASKEIRIINSEGDFYQVQNYVIQLVSENRMTPSSFLLYSFYKSLAGFDQITCSYEYIRLNTGLSKGSISNGTKQLQKLELINVINYGPNKSFEIQIIPGNQLQRRKLKKIRNYDDPRPHTVIEKNNISQKQTDEVIDFINSFTSYWCKMNNTDKYRKNDLAIAEKIDNISLASDLIPVLWKLNDKWVQESDKSMTIFVKEYMNGKLQSTYPNTKFYYMNKRK